MAERVGHVWILADRSALPAALAAALRVAGWPAVHLFSPEALDRAARRPGPTPRLVVVADQRGHLPDPRPALSGRMQPLVVAIGPRPALSALADAVERRVTRSVLDADQPFTDLVRALDAALAQPITPPDAAHEMARLVTELRDRDAAAERFDALTTRERQVLGQLIIGRVAAEIASGESISMPTARSHIRSILTKLGVSSQLAAVALAQKACREPTVVAAMRQVHQF